MRKKKIRNGIIWGALGVILILFVYLQFLRKPPVYIDFQQEEVVQETLYTEVFATGTINPIEMVDVGTQVSGKISDVMVDFNDRVKEGQVLARMDTRTLKASMDESKANLKKAQIAMQQSDRSLKRTRELFSEGMVAEVELEKAQDEYNNALATYNISKLQLERNSVNLGYADIVSPIEGIVISRNIEVGQTVAAAFTTPTLFSIANDLQQMKIEASIDEADIGQVKVGQSVVFTVDAYPDEEFRGVVGQIQLQPTVVQNVVTYNVIVLIQNPEQKLMPGMTATLIIQTEEKPNSITIPNSALTFELTDDDRSQLRKKKYQIADLKEKARNTVWVLRNKKLNEIAVDVDFTNGIRTAIISDLAPGDSVVTNLKIHSGEEANGGLFTPPHR